MAISQTTDWSKRIAYGNVKAIAVNTTIFLDLTTGRTCEQQTTTLRKEFEVPKHGECIHKP